MQPGCSQRLKTLVTSPTGSTCEYLRKPPVFPTVFSSHCTSVGNPLYLAEKHSEDVFSEGAKLELSDDADNLLVNVPGDEGLGWVCT